LLVNAGNEDRAKEIGKQFHEDYTKINSEYRTQEEIDTYWLKVGIIIHEDRETNGGAEVVHTYDETEAGFFSKMFPKEQDK